MRRTTGDLRNVWKSNEVALIYLSVIADSLGGKLCIPNATHSEPDHPGDSECWPCCPRLIESCEHCNGEGAEIPFDAVLDRVTGSSPGARL